MRQKVKKVIDKEKVMPATIILMIAVYIVAVLYAIDSHAKPIPHSICEWHYIGDTIVTDCGHKITDGCPFCAKKILIVESEETEAGKRK